MNILEKLHAIDTSLVKDEALLEELKGVIFEYDEKDQDSVDNAHTIYEMLTDTYPEIGGKVTPKEEEIEITDNADIIAEKEDTPTTEVKSKKKKKKKKKTKVDGVEGEASDEKEPEKGLEKEPEIESQKEPEKEPEKEAAQPPIKKKITQDTKGGCKDVITEIKKVLSTFQGKKKAKVPVKKKALAVIVKESVVIIIKRVLEREKRVNPQKKVDVKKFESVIEKGKDFLKALRKASGGISDDNDQMISSFENQVNEILTVIKSDQEKEAA